ncbi:hypothetical protein KCTC32516_01815 [Polaribacter huanghezhanensis]|uniref:CCC motif membrane protein n=1 Tax=Polaribacter huanghezhanensis TaxID=1354726 RepID=UPI002649917B|nr:CCC motif membrane protein [Polaribacter huanghezhanensis]WKD86440.1 hypothetical protein KCTC32516_01815 [Polaribacter huanghezhanensis]
MEKQKLPNSTTVLVLGIISIITCCCYGIIGLILGIIALVLANSAKKIYLETPENYTGYSNVTTGKILSIIGIILNLIYLGFIVYILTVIGWEALQDPTLLQEKMLEF